MALLITLSVLQVFVARLAHDNRTTEKVLSGALFGGICVIGMMLPVEVTQGVIVDPRSVILSMAALFGGPIVAAFTAMIASTYRLFLGGDGVYVGVMVILICSGFGLAYRYTVQKGWTKVNFIPLFLFGLMLHVVQLLLFTYLPAEIVEKVMTIVAIPLILIFTPATALLGMLLQDIENRFKTE